MIHNPEFNIKLDTAGFIDDLYCDSLLSRCGRINGVGLHFGDDAGGVLSFESLERLYFRAREIRETDYGKATLKEWEQHK